MASKGLSLLDRRLLDLASNGYTPDEISQEVFIPPEQAVGRIKELLASHDIYDEVETRRLAVHSLQKLKGQVEAAMDPANPKAVEALTKTVLAIDRLQSKTAAISDSELERLAQLQAIQIVQLIELAYGRARQLLADEYPEVDLGRIDDVFHSSVQEVVPQIEA